jgi:DNA-binding MarR family transcriptional regulator
VQHIRPQIDPTSASPADEVSALLVQLALQRLMPRYVGVVTELGLSPPQAHLLLRLGEGRSISQRELARELACDPSNLTGISDRLEARGLVERRADHDDRRIKAIVATAAGEALRAQLEARLAEPPEVVRRLSTEDQVRLRDLLLRLFDEP